MTASVDADALVGSGLPEGSTVASAELAVTVVIPVPDPVMLRLAFDPMSLEVEAGSTATAVLSLLDVPEGTEVEVTLSVADETTAQVLSQLVLFTADTTSHDVMVLGVAEGSVTVMAVADDSDLPDGSTVAPADLVVTVVLPTVELQLAFAPMSLEVAAGSTATAVLSLPGVPVGAAVTVSLRTDDAVTAQVVTPGSIVFDAATPSRDVTVEGVTVGNATLTAELASFDGLSTVSTVASADLAVTVVPAPVELQLAFAPAALTVVAGATETAVLSLLDVPADAAVTVTLSVPDATTARVVTPELVTFTAQTPSTDVTVFGVAAGSVAVTAVADDSGLPASSTVVSADLAVTVVPAPVMLRLAFAPPALEVTAGATATAVLSLAGVPADAAVTVTLSAASTATAEVTPGSVTFTATTTSRDVTVLGVVAGEVTLTAIADTSDLPLDSTVVPADLAVTVVPAPVMLRLAFAPPDLTVTAGATATAVLSLLDVPADAAVTVTLSVPDATTARLVTEPELRFSATTPSHVVTIEGVAEGSVAVTAVEDVLSGLPPGSTVVSADLAVTVVPAPVVPLPVELQLAFAPPTLTVAVGSEETAVLSLPDVPAGAEVTVSLSAADAATARLVTEPELRFSATTPSHVVTIEGVAEGSVTVMAVEDVLSGLPAGSSVVPADLAVTVVPAPVVPLPVELQLAFVPPTLTVAVGSEAEATLSLPGVPADAEVTVTLSVPDAATARLVTEPELRFSATTPSHVVTVEGVAEGSVTVMAVEDVLSGLPAGSSVASADLAVTVVPAPVVPLPVELQLAFVPPTLTVAVGSEAEATLSLPGVPAGATVTVMLSAASTATAEVTPESVTFTATTPSHVVTVEGVAEGSVTVMAVEDVLSGLPAGSSVASADLAVTVVPAPVVPLPVELQLAFAPTALEVTAGATATAVLSLPGVPEGAEVTVSLSVADAATARLVTEPELRFSATTPSHVVTVEGVAEGSVTVMAVEDVLSGLPAGSSVASADLAVTVVPVPEPPGPVELQLAFEPTTLTVAAGSEETVVLSLAGVPEGATVTVTLSSADTATALVMPSTVTFTAQTPSRDVTVLGVAEGSVTVMAVEDVLSGLPAGSTVASADLAVTIVPAPVVLQLVFAPTALEVTAGATATAELSLADVPADAAVTVTLSSADTATARVMPSTVMFTADTTSPVVTATVTVTGVAEGSVTVMAVEDVLSGLPAGSSVASADLAVTVVPAPEPVELQLAFAPPTLTVAVGSEETAVLSLPDVPAGAEVTVSLSVADAATARLVTEPELRFSATTPSHVVTVEGVAEGSVTVMAVEDVSSDLPAGSSVASADLAVTVVPAPVVPLPVELQLAFAPPTLTVAVGSEEAATLSLAGVPEGAEVTVSLSVADAATARLVTEPELRFSATTPSHVVTIEGVAEGSVAVTAVEDVLSGLPPGSTVVSADLAVTVVPAPVVPLPVELQLAFAPPTLTVAVGSEETAVLSLPDVPAGAEVTVSLSAADAATARLVTEPELRFSATTPSHVVTIEGVAEGSVTVMAVEDVLSGLPAGSSVVPADLAVTVVPAPVVPLPVELQLAFVPPTLTVAVGSEAEATLSLPGVPADAEVTVTLSVPDAATARLVTEPELRFSATTPGHVVTVEGVAAGSATLTAAVDENALAGFGLPPDSTVASADLAVTVVPAPVMLRLAFDLPELTVAEEARRTVQLRLVGDVPAGAEVTVTLSAASTAAVQVTPESVTLSADTQSSVVTVTGVATGSATVTAAVGENALAGSGLPEGSTVASAELAVTVTPAVLVPAMLRLAFDPMSLTVAVGSEETAVLSLLDVPEGTEVEVTLSVADETTAQVLSQPVLFTADTTSHDVTVLGVAAGSVTVTASADVSGLPDGSTVAPADLVVTVESAPVVPLPVELQLAFVPPTLTVAVGSEETAVLSLPDVPAGAEVMVSLSVADAATARLVTEPELRFSATTLSHVVTVEGVAEGSVTVMAVEDVSGLPEGSSVAPADLVVTVVPAPVVPLPVELELAFEPPALEVVVGATATATLSLLDVPAGATVTVMLSAASTATAEVTPESVTFTVAIPSRDVTVLGVAAGSVAVTAVADDSGLPAGSTVASADLVVTVVPVPEPPEPVELQLAFAPPTLTVAVGSEETAVLSLPDVPAGAEVTVSLSAADAATTRLVTESELRFSATTPSHVVTVEGVAEGSVTVMAVEDVSSDLPEGSTVVPADLVVTVVPAPVELQLAFEPPALEVVVGATATATLRLLGDVPAGAEVTVELSVADASTAVRVISDSSVEFAGAATSREVTVLGVAAESVTLMAEADVSGLPEGSTVAPAQLQVTVVPAPVELQLAFAPSALEVTAGSEETAVLSLPGVPEGAEVTVTLSVPDATTARLVMEPELRFSATTPSHVVTVEGVAAGSVTITADEDDISDLPTDSTVASADLAVTVVPAPEPVELQLAFAPLAVTVAVGSEAEATLSLAGVPEGAEVTVTLSVADAATARLVTEPELRFSATTPSHIVTIEGVAEGSVTVMAVEDVLSGLPAGSSVASADLVVTVVPAPVELQLAFAPSALEVTVGATATAVLILLGVPADAEVTVELSVADAATARLVTEPELRFSATTLSHAVTVEGVAEGSVTVMAVEGVLSGLPEGSTVAPADLTVTVVPEPVELQLAFAPPAVTVAVGSEETAVLSLPGVPEGAEVTVTLSVPDAATARLVTEPELRFSATTLSHAVTVEGVAEGSVTVMAVEGVLSGLPEGSTVAPADLAVTVVPAPVQLQLAFAPPDLTVTAGSEETAVLSLPGVPADAEVTVTLSVADATTARLVTEPELRFSATTPSHVVTVEGVAEGSVTVMAVEDVLSGLPAGSSVAPADLVVTVVPAPVVPLPVELQLAFAPPTLTVAVGSEAEATLSLAGVPAGAEVTVSLSAADAATARLVTEPELRFSATTPSHVVTVEGVAEGSVTVMAVEDVLSGLPAGSSVASADLVVTVVPAPEPPEPVELQLAFAPPTLTVAVGSEETAVLSLLDVPAGAEVTVSLSAADAATARLVTEPELRFSATTPSHVVTVEGVAEGSVTVMAVEDVLSGLPEGSSVVPADLVVTVVPAPEPVELQLAFVPPTLTVAVGSEETAVLSLLDVPAGAEVTVSLSAADAATARLVTEPELRFSATTPSHVVTIEGVAEGSVTVMAVEDVLSGLPAGSSVASADLVVTVVPAPEPPEPVELQLAFAPPTLTVAVGSEEAATLSLAGVPAGAEVTVSLSAADAATARLVTEPELRFSATTPSHVVTIEGVAAGSVTITADEDDISDLPTGSTVMSADLAVTVVPAPVVPLPVELQLAFAPPTLTVAVGSEETATLSLPDVPAGAEVTVSLSVADAATARLVTEPELRFSATTPSHIVTVEGVAAGSVTITADEDDISDLPTGSSVASADLAVTVVPVPEPPEPVELQLAFAPPTLTVAVGSEETAVLSLLDVPAGAEVTVSLSAADAATARLVTEPELRFSATTPSHVVTVEGVAEGSVTVMAVEDVLSGLPAGSSVASADLAVTVVPAPVVPLPVELQLAFAPPTLTVAVGSEETAVLSLPDVPAGAEVTVSLSAADAATARLVTEPELRFSATTPSHVVTIEGVAAGSVTITADEDDISDLPTGSTVMSADLAVTVVPAPVVPLPVELQLAFAPPTLTVAVGSEETATLSLPDVPAGAEVTVSLSVADAATARLVTEPELRFSATTPSHIVTVEGVAAGSVTITADEDDISDLPTGSSVASADLAVTVVPVPEPPEPVELQLAFAPPTLTVAVGSEETAVLGLPDVPAGAEVTVSLSAADAATARLVTEPELRFSATTPSHVVTVEGVAEGSVTVMAVEDVLSGLPEGSTVVPADLVVTVVPAPEPPEPVELQLAFAPPTLTVAVGSEETAVLSLLDVPAGAEVTVSLSAADAATARLVTEPELRFSATTPSHVVTVEGVAEGSVTVMAVEDVLSGLPAGSSVAPADLVVTVVPAPVELQLAFEPPALEVVVGATATATLRLLGDVPAGAEVTVELSVADASTAVRVISDSSVEFAGAATSREVTVLGVVAESVTLMAEADVSGLPEGSTVAPAQLQVTVVPLPVELELAFEPPALEVVVGATATATLSLLDVPAGASVTVELSVADASTAVRVISDSSVEFTGAATSREVTVLGVAAESVTLMAEADVSGLPEGSTVAPAQLQVTVLPAPVMLQLAFELPALEVVAGVAATATLVLPDVPEGAEVRVELSATDGEATVLVMPSTVMFTADTPNRDVTVTGVAAGSVTLTASVGEAALADSDLPPNSSVASAELVVTVLPAPVELVLVFDRLALTVAAGAERTAQLRLTGDVPADAAVTVTLSATNTAIAEVTPESVMFTAEMQSSVVTVLGVAEGSATVTAILDVSSGLPEGSTVSSAELPVTVLPAVEPVMLQLVFAPTSLEVEAGATATAVLRLEGVPGGTEVVVTVGAADATTAVRVISDSSVEFAGAATSREVTVLGVAAGSVTLTAEADISGLPEGSAVEPAQLQVTVVLPTVDLQLSFAPMSLEVAVDATATAMLRLEGVPATGASVTVRVSVADEMMARVLTPQSVVFDAAMPSRDVTVEGVTEGNATVTAEFVSFSGLSTASIVRSEELAVTVVPAPVMLQLAFELPALEVVAGVAATATLVLPDVPEGASVTVTLSSADTSTALVMPSTVTFTATTQSRAVTLTGVAAGSVAVMAAVTADDLASSGLPGGSTVVPAELVVTVVPAPVELELAFEPPALEVVVGATATATLSLLDVPAGASVTVELSVADASTAVRVISDSSVEFTGAATSREVTVLGVAAESVTLMAEADVSGLPEGSTVAPAQLQVTVVPAPVELELAFEPPALEVVVGATATATLSLLDVPEGAEVTVELSVADASTAVRVISDSSVEFAGAATSREVTVLGVAAGSVTLMAEADVSGLPEGSTVAPAQLQVTVLPAPVELELAFEPPALEVVVGATATATLSLLDVPAGASVTVELSVADASTAVRVISDSSVEFAGAATSREVTVLGVAAESVTLMAEADVSGLPEGSTVAPAQLQVTVLPAPVELELAFEPPALEVVVGATATATLSLPDVPANAAVTVTLSSADTATARVMPSTVMFTADTTSPVVTATVTVTGVAAESVTLMAEADVSGLPEGSTVAPAQLQVTVLPAPVELQLAFAPPTLTVAAGSEETVVLSLAGVPEGATVTVTLSSADTATALVMPSTVTFTAQTPSPVVTATVTVAGVAAGSATLTAVEDALTDSGLPAGSTVAPAELAVTVVPAPVMLELAFAPPAVTVAVGNEETAVLSLSGVPEGAAVTVTLSSADTATALVMPSTVTFTADTPSRDVTVAGVVAGSATLTAVEDALTDSGLPAGSTVAPAELAVTVVPAPPVMLRLAFESPTLTVAAGSEETAVLSLSDVPAGATVTVTLSSADTATALVMPSTVTFTADTPSPVVTATVTVTGVAAGSVALTARLDASRTSGLPDGSTVAPAELQVTVVEAPGLRLRVRVLLEGPLQ